MHNNKDNHNKDDYNKDYHKEAYKQVLEHHLKKKWKYV